MANPKNQRVGGFFWGLVFSFKKGGDFPSGILLQIFASQKMSPMRHCLIRCVPANVVGGKQAVFGLLFKGKKVPNPGPKTKNSTTPVKFGKHWRRDTVLRERNSIQKFPMKKNWVKKAAQDMGIQIIAGRSYCYNSEIWDVILFSPIKEILHFGKNNPWRDSL